MVVDFLSMSSVNFLIPEPRLIYLTMKVRTATCAGARAATVAALASGAGGNADCLWSLFSMRHRLVGQVIFAVDFRATFAASGKSPMRSPAPVCTDKSAWHHVFS